MSPKREITYLKAGISNEEILIKTSIPVNQIERVNNYLDETYNQEYTLDEKEERTYGPYGCITSRVSTAIDILGKVYIATRITYNV